MATVHYQGGEGLRSIFDELEDLFSSSFDLIGRQVGKSYPPIDVVEEENIYKVFIDLPGMSKNDIQINIEQGILIINGNKKRSVEQTEKGRYYHFERGFGTFSRSFNLPENVDIDSVDAHYRDGVLEIRLKKMTLPHPKPIEIKVE